MSWIDDELLHLVEWTILEDVVDSPWTIPDLEIVTFCEIFWELFDFFLELFFICLIFELVDEIR
jgi:hypothetical protein